MLEVVESGSTVELAQRKQRALLAVLLLHANTPVSTEKLVDELWDATAPANAAKSVQIYISGLRKRLGADRISTTPGGYVLHVEPDELDSQRFEELARTGGEALAVRDARRADRVLVEALALWAGPALADFRLDRFAQDEIRRLDGLRDTAAADRVDARLALGRPEQVIPELESMVRANPLRERPRGQLMLALYRAGRQSDALELYRSTHALFLGELGIEPGPDLQNLERSILNHDPELGGRVTPPRSPPGTPRLTSRQAGLRIGVIGGGLLALTAALVFFLLSGRGNPPGIVSVAPDSLAVLDASTNRVAGEVSIVGTPSQVVAAGGLIWVWSISSRTLTGIDPRTLAAKHQLAPNAFADELVPGGKSALWLLDNAKHSLVEIDGEFGSVVRRIGLPPSPASETVETADQSPSGDAGPPTAVRLAVVDHQLWLTDGSTGVVEIDGLTGRTIRRLDLGVPLDAISAGAKAVWALSGTRATLFEIDARDGRVVNRIPLLTKPGIAAPFPFGLVAGDGAVWVLNGNSNSVTRVDPRIGAVTATIPLGTTSVPETLAVGDGAVWIADNGDGTVSRIDSTTDELTVIHVGGAPAAVVLDGPDVFVSVQPSLGSSTVSPAATLSPTAAAKLGALPSSFCSPVYYDGTHIPRFLIAADLPLQGFGGLSLTAQMSDAVRYALAEQSYRAGRYPIGYQLCDDSSAQFGRWSSSTCTRNARAYASNTRLLGVIGPFNSGCAELEIPIAESAARGPIPMISPSATYVGLTRGGAGTATGEPERYYPKGIRNFFRVIANDDVQGAADARAAESLHVKRLFILQDGSAYGRGLAAAVRSSAEKLGVRIAGQATWQTTATSFGALASRIGRTHADGVFIAGTIDESGVPLLKALRSTLGTGERILGPDGFTPFPALLDAGLAAEDVTVSVAESPTGRLDKAGARFATSFAAAVGAPTEPYSVAAAQATDDLVAAIAHSNGTRESVIAELHRLPTLGGILGDFRFDRNGDTTAGVVTIYRIEHGRPVIWRVIRPSSQ